MLYFACEMWFLNEQHQCTWVVRNAEPQAPAQLYQIQTYFVTRCPGELGALTRSQQMQFFTSRQCLPQIKVPGTLQMRHLGGPPMKTTSPLLVSSTKPEKPKYPPSRLHGSQGQTTDIAIQSMSCKQKLAEGASGRTSVPPMTSCPDKH